MSERGTGHLKWNYTVVRKDGGNSVRVIVQKFGGTSVAGAEAREKVAGHVRAALDEGFAPVVVVSAMGRRGDPYATDTLIGLARSVFDDVKPRELDLLQSCGEVISTVVTVQTLMKAGIRACAFTGGQAGIMTDRTFTNARILEVKPEAVHRCLADGQVAVVAGFQGMTDDGETTTIGRGGSDTTAAALGVAMRAEVIDIFTDVEGIMTADPRLAPEARLLDVMTYSEVCEMAHMGARVVHPRAVEIAMDGRVPLRIRSTFSDRQGTLITDGRTPAGVEIRSDRVVTSIAHVTSVTLFRIASPEDVNQSGLALKVFQRLAEAGISIDLIHVSPDQISFIIKTDLRENALSVLTELAPQVSSETGYAKVSAVGAGMRGVPGVMARVVRGLNKAGVPIFQTTDSHTNISCLVHEADLSSAVKALHDEFGLAAPGGETGGNA